MNKQDFINEILDLELAMFLSVKTDQPAPCQEDPVGFRKNRSAHYKNMMEKVYEHMVKGLGYHSIEEAEEVAGKKG